MIKKILNEDKRPQKLSIWFIPKISDKITEIIEFNYNNQSALTQWEESIEGMKDYISNPVIAFDYIKRCRHNPSGTMCNNYFGYNITYAIKQNKISGIPYVCIFDINLKLEEFGLKDPSKIQEYKQPIDEAVQVIHLTESDIQKMVIRVIQEIVAKQKRVGEFTAIAGNWWDGIPHGLEYKGCDLQDVRMYDSKEITIALFRRCDNLKYFYAKIVPEEGKETKWQPLKLFEVPQIIRRDFSTINAQGHEPYL